MGIIKGFQFDDEEAYQSAKKEQEYINRISASLNTSNANQVLEVYNKIIEDNIFCTPVGMEYLRTLQKRLSSVEGLDKSEIKPIPAISSTKEEKKEQPDLSLRKEKSELRQARKRAEKYHDLYVKMLIVNGFLILMIIVMFIISENSKKFDEDYFRESIENEYIDWQKSLEERENNLP